MKFEVKKSKKKDEKEEDGEYSEPNEEEFKE
jgi:hypothetical protein